MSTIAQSLMSTRHHFPSPGIPGEGQGGDPLSNTRSSALRRRTPTPTLPRRTGGGGLVMSLLCVLLAHHATGAEVQNKIDWPAFMSRHDLVFNNITEKWGEGAYTGNGLMGVMVYLTDDKSALRFRVGRTDVMVQKGQAYRVPIGDLLLRPVGKITGGTMRMDETR